MNRLYFRLVNVTLLLFAGLAYSGELDSSIPNPYAVTYPFKSAVIHYAIKNEYGHGKISKGTEVVYIKGDELAKVTKIAIPDPEGTTKNVETLHLFTPDYVYMIDLFNKTGTKIDNSKKYARPAYNSLSEEEKKAFHKRMERRKIIALDLRGLGKKVGTDTILGRKCDVYQAGEELTPENLPEALLGGEGSSYRKSWIWKEAKIPLRVIISGVGWSNELIVTKIEENVKIHDSRFTVPSDIKVTYDEVKSDFAKQRALARFHMLKTGQSKPIKVKLEERIIRPGETPKVNESGGEENQ
jgi:hypothetical protein